MDGKLAGWKIGWSDRLKELRSVLQSPAVGQLMASVRDQYWGQYYYLASLRAGWIIRRSLIPDFGDNSSWKRGVRICERNNSADTKVSEEGGGRGAPGTRAEIPLQPVVKTMVRQAVLLQPMEVNSGADIHPAACEGPHVGAGGCARRRLWPCGEPALEQAPGRTCDPMEREEPMLEQFCWQDL
ncbi:hypothetical protein QYF61_019796 [Mycteria americana]|uniref:Uncharacterized protein n=1 Tax=Mycteria americana TaxID=33587 RepID=A0AAN7N9E5_MYCAM|nr:hypothetical protein QYF61_019796 [Mycteria americana]